MHERTGSRRWLALAVLAGALAWSPPIFAVESGSETRATPSEQPVYHTVEPGETLWDIAERYGTSAARLMRENEIEDAQKIWVGTRLRVPGSSAGTRGPDAEGPHEGRATGSPEITALIDRCEAELRAARFEQALASAGEARELIDAREGPASGRDRARLEVASATAYVALGQNDAALESLERALVADPDLELDPALTSPKVLAVFRAARGRAPRPR